MGKRNRNRGNKGNNNGNHTTETAKDVMVKIMNLLDSGAILDAITDRRVISSASDRLVNHDYEIEAFDQIVDLFQISLTSSEIRAVVNVLNPVIFTLGDIPTKESDIAVLVYQKFVEYLGKNGQDKDCIKSYETLMAVREIVQSDLDDIGKSVSEDTLTTLAVVEMLYTVTDLLVGQVWDDMRMAASSSNIPDRDKVEVVIDTNPPKQEESPQESTTEEPKAERVPDDQVEVIEPEVEEPKQDNTQTNQSTFDKKSGIFGIPEDAIKALIMGLAETGDVENIVDKIGDMVIPSLKGEFNVSDKTSSVLKEFIKSLLEDVMPKDLKRIEDSGNPNPQTTPTQTDPSAVSASCDVIVKDIKSDVMKFFDNFKSTFESFDIATFDYEMKRAVKKFTEDGSNLNSLRDNYNVARPVLIDFVKDTVSESLGNRLLDKAKREGKSYPITVIVPMVADYSCLEIVDDGNGEVAKFEGSYHNRHLKRYTYENDRDFRRRRQSRSEKVVPFRNSDDDRRRRGLDNFAKVGASFINFG